jgi:transcriptional regulator with XRE-family HTH domain
MTRTQYNKRFAKWIKERRSILGWTQAELASKTGMTQDWISHFEGGRRVPDSFAFSNLQEHLGRFN